VEQSKQISLPFARISGKKVIADFEGGCVTSDGGTLVLRSIESRIGIISKVVSALRDRRHPSYVSHSLEELLKQRVFQIACGYDDADDCDELRRDPGFKAACDRLPITGNDLASQPTMTRLENSVSRTDLYRIARVFVDAFLGSYKKPPKAIILDVDDTDDPTHGSQQLSMFNAYYDEHCYLPLHVYEGRSGKLITTILRPGKQMNGSQAVSILKRLVGRILEAWPDVEIILRADSKFSSPEVHDFCEDNGIYYVLGFSMNPKLKRIGQPLMDQALALAKQTDGPVRLFTNFSYQADTWRQPRRLVYKAEVTLGDANPRSVVTNLQSSTAKFIYEQVYCARGRMEGFIKDHKTFLHSDRTSCHRFEANQFRLFLHSAAYVLMHTLREQGLRGTRWATAQFNTIQNRILKIGARVIERATKIQFHFPTSYPLKHTMRTVHGRFESA
jgi:DDE family transposase